MAVALALAGALFGWLLGRAARDIDRQRRAASAPRATYVALSLATAASFFVSALGFRRTTIAVVVGAFSGVMLLCGLVDVRHRIVPNRVVYPSLLAFGAAIALLGLAHQGVSLSTAALGCLAYGGALLGVALLAPSAMGMGDVKLAALIGLVLGGLGWRYVAVAAVAGTLSGGVAAAVVLATGGRPGQTMPFGPYLAAGAILSALLAA